MRFAAHEREGIERLCRYVPGSRAGPALALERLSTNGAGQVIYQLRAPYRPALPSHGFDDLDAARTWASDFVRWYKKEHRHSGIRYVSPAQRHAGEDTAVLAARHRVYTDAKTRNPARWSGHTRNRTPIGAVTLYLERDGVISNTSGDSNTRHDAA